MLSKTLVWLEDTLTGDKSEINIPRRDNHLWDKISAAGTKDCETLQGICPLRAARARADGSTIVVVNHSLLIADAAIGGGILPQYDYLIVDEAHHLVEEATKQFGYSVSSEQLADLFKEIGREIGNFKSLVTYRVRNSNQKLQLTKEAEETSEVLKHLTNSWDSLTAMTSRFVQNQQEQGNQLRVTRSTRKQPDWANIEIGWENLNQTLDKMGGYLLRLHGAIDSIQSVHITETASELTNLNERIDETKLQIADFIVQHDDEKVYWINLTGTEYLPTFNSVPLEVNNKLHDAIFSQKKSTILTSATLSIDGSLDYLANETGLEDADHLIVGSPFDYKTSALVLTAPDIPEPSESGYQQKLEDILIQAAEASNGGMLVLFTSHSALQNTRKRIKPILETQGITVLAQGVDGSPDHLMKSMATNRNTVLLGTSSLWEGIDLPGDVLRVVVLARLPFAVPTDPIVSARSEKYEDPFSKLTIPQAILRFRQGFGRLIRTSNDRGVVLILDSRIVNRPYGKIFLRSLPNATFHETASRNIGHEIRNWLKT
jgi:DNA polymerase-3 subunit epsilon/ATP-dependent DNA helicase DinG